MTTKLPGSTLRAARLLFRLCLVLGIAGNAAMAAERQPFDFLYVSLEGDPAYRPGRAYTGLVLRDRYAPRAGAESALKEVRIIGRSVGRNFGLKIVPVEDPSAIVAEVEKAIRGVRSQVILLDLPLEPFLETVRAFGRRHDLILFNIRHSGNSLRGQNCAPALFHTLPSTRMLTDAIGQYLKSRGWDRILVLAGEGAQDRALADGFEQSAGKFGLTIAGRRAFVLSNDPREREKNNIRLLTGGERYDVIFLADTQGEFGRYVPFGSFLARPVVGTEGLVPSAWHWTWERHGAPQLNQRFDRKAKRHMGSEDWAAWAAIRSIVEAIVRSGKHDIPSIRAMLTSDAFTFDAYKGFPANYRSWNNQLRQPILLHTHNAVIARAPVEGFLHKDNLLDSLGVDRQESRCRFD